MVGIKVCAFGCFYEIGIVQLEGLTLDSVSQRVDQKEEHVHEKKFILHPLDNGEQHVVGTTSFSLDRKSVV